MRIYQKNTGVVLFGTLALAAALRLYGLGAEDYWLDEIHSLANSAGRRAEFEAVPYGTIVHHYGRPSDLNAESTVAAAWVTMRYDSHPPLYFMLLYGWRRLVGDGEAAVRVLAVIFSVLSIIPVFFLLRVATHQARKSKRPDPTPEATRTQTANKLSIVECDRQDALPWSALVAGLLLAFAATHIWMAQENRPYSLALFLVTGSCYFLVRGESIWSMNAGRAKLRIAVFYGLSLYLAILTHYFTGLVFLGQGIYAALCFRGSTLRWWLGSVAAGALAAAVTWGPTFLQQLDFIRAQPWLLEQTPDHAWRTILRATDMPVRLLIFTARFQRDAWHSAIGIVFLFACLLLALRQDRRLAILFALWYALPVLVLGTLDLATDKQLLTHLRYAVVALPGLAGLAALAFARLRPRFRAVTLVLLLSVLAARLHLPAASNLHARAAVRQLQTLVAEKDLLVFDAIAWPDWVPQFFAPLWHYMPNRIPPFLLLRDPPSVDLQREIAAFPRIIVISPRIDAVPNPSPETHRAIGQSDYIYQVGWIYAFERRKPENQPGVNAPESVPLSLRPDHLARTPVAQVEGSTYQYRSSPMVRNCCPCSESSSM